MMPCALRESAHGGSKPIHSEGTHRFEVQFIVIGSFVAQAPVLLQLHQDLDDPAGLALTQADFLSLPAFPFPDRVALGVPDHIQNPLVFMKHAYDFHGGMLQLNPYRLRPYARKDFDHDTS
jgi:hypothetical protein